MAGRDYLKGHASTSKAPGNDTAWSGENAGPYIGVVKNNIDPLRMGRLQVNIPGLSKTTDPVSGNLITCEYLSPFYGAKDVRYNLPGSTKYEHSQHSYGFWAVPPDIGTRVLVIFAEGKMDQAFWIGCVQDPLTNHMVPGIAASEKTWDKSSGGAAGQFSSDVDKQSQYGSTSLPAGEVNRTNPGLTATNYNSINKPIHPFADTLLKQGLSADNVRGNTSSSARRETPSQVFGISTPGRKDIGTTRQKVGTKDSEATDYVSRTTGHTFVMDDGAVDGTNQLTRLRTASGHQLLMHDTEGVVYIANGSGNAWIEMQRNGRIDVYSGIGGINLRTEGDFNLHSDSNINMHANGQVRFSSAGEMIHSANMMLNLGDQGIYSSAQNGSVMTYAKQGISSYTDAQQLHGSGGETHLAGSQVHFNSTRASPSWGPGWLTTDLAGINLREEGDVELTQKGIKPLEQFTRKTKTTVHRFVTHEPMFRASVITGDGIIPIDPDDKKQWAKRANTPGTPEFINQQLRLNANSNLREAIYQEDAFGWLKQKMGSSTDPIKAKQLLTEFGLKYNEIYGITDRINLPFDIKDSISEKIKGIDFNTPAKDLVSSLSSQVVEKFSGKSTELFKDNVFVNQAGELFTLGSNTISGVTGNIDLANNALNSVQGLTKNLSIGNIDATVANLNSITQTYSSVVGGKIVGISQVQTLASKLSGSLLGTSSANNLPPSLRGTAQGRIASIGSAIKTQVGNIAGKIKSFFGGGGGFGGGSVGKGLGSFKGLFGSDIRLKEDIQKIGTSPSGLNIYRFKYKHMEGTYEGVMAQEVPWASVMTETGFYAVDYNKVDVEFRRLN